MGFFNRLFSSSETSSKNTFDWIPLNDLQQLEEILTHSYEKIVVIFKHSTRCAISRFALNRFENEFNFPKEHIELFYLDLLTHRDISNEIARKFEIEHQSPQILVIKKQKGCLCGLARKYQCKNFRAICITFYKNTKKLYSKFGFNLYFRELKIKRKINK